jgi:hypothetical protein
MVYDTLQNLQALYKVGLIIMYQLYHHFIDRLLIVMVATGCINHYMLCLKESFLAHIVCITCIGQNMV